MGLIEYHEVVDLMKRLDCQLSSEVSRSNEHTFKQRRDLSQVHPCFRLGTLLDHTEKAHDTRSPSSITIFIRQSAPKLDQELSRQLRIIGLVALEGDAERGLATDSMRR